MTTNDVVRIYETVLSMPGMSDPVKLDARINRKAVLLLHNLVEHGLQGKEGKTGGVAEAFAG